MNPDEGVKIGFARPELHRQREALRHAPGVSAPGGAALPY